jgi:hypothetical protein
VSLLGNVVLFRLSERDAADVNRRRLKKRSTPHDWHEGAQRHVGDTVAAGDVFPMIITRCWGADDTIVNGQVLLDGSDTLWVTSRARGELNGAWLGQ